ncbi:MAG TPA: hypothetical protein VEG08_15230 [Terriglobales bacterium]|nr:hypothetical protein [Terriglobales bacterium]
MADEELLRLARDQGSLLEAARLTLEEELRKRGLSVEDTPQPSAEPSPPAEEAPSLWQGWKTAFQAEEDAPPPKGLLARTGKLHAFYLETLRLYRDHFRLFASFIVPAALLNFGIWVVRRLANRALAQALLPDTLGPWRLTPSFLAAATAVNLTTALSAWTVTSAAFACIVTAVDRLGRAQEVRVRDCCVRLQARLGPFLRATVLAGILTGLGFGAAGGIVVVLFTIVEALTHSPGMSVTSATVALYVLAALVLGVLARMAFTIPLVMTESTSAMVALKSSNRLSDRFVLRIWLALMESEIVTYLVVLGMHKGQSYLAEQFPFPFWSQYPLGAGATVLVGLLQVPAMIAITLLYFRARERAAAKL